MWVIEDYLGQRYWRGSNATFQCIKRQIALPRQLECASIWWFGHSRSPSNRANGPRDSTLSWYSGNRLSLLACVTEVGPEARHEKVFENRTHIMPTSTHMQYAKGWLLTGRLAPEAMCAAAAKEFLDSTGDGKEETSHLEYQSPRLCSSLLGHVFQVCPTRLQWFQY